MLPFILTGLAGIAIGIVAMRLMQGASANTPANTIITATHDGTSADMPVINAAPDGDAPDAAPPPAPQSYLSSRYQMLRGLPRNQMLLGGAALLTLFAVGALALRGDDIGSAASTAASSNAVSPGSVGMQAPAGTLDDVDTMVARLEARLAANPNDGEGFRTLGWSYQNTGHPDKAVTAYARAAALLPGRADVLSAYGEAMVSVANDSVSPNAKRQFEAALAIDRNEPRARFFIALHKSQNGQERAALDEWIAIANASPANLPWQADLRTRVERLAARLGVNVAGRLPAVVAPVAGAMPGAPNSATVQGSGAGPTAGQMTAASALPASDQQAMINGMVGGLAARLAASPDDVEGWVRLIRSRMVLNDRAAAARDVATARRTFATQAEKLSAINRAAVEYGL
ncbi:MAG: hypothetical protein AABZ45_05195 [Pseudomonadota bacterium]